MNYLIISCETTGIGPNTRNVGKFNDRQYYQPLSWGLVVVDEDFKKIDELYVEIKYNGEYKPVIWDPAAQRVHNLTPIKLDKNGIEEYEAVEEIGSLIVEHFDTNPIRIIGYNPTFSQQFLDDMFKRYNIQLKFDYHLIDLHTLGMALLGTYSKKDLYQMFGIEGKRNSLLDARNIHKCISQIRKMWSTLL